MRGVQEGGKKNRLPTLAVRPARESGCVWETLGAGQEAHGAIGGVGGDALGLLRVLAPTRRQATPG